MRDLFAILAIIAAVVGLGVFRVPSQNALIEAGLAAQAQTALLDVVHPLTISVSGREITVSGRVETEEARADVLAALAALEGVEAVQDELDLLPNVAPFVFTIEKRDGLSFAGHLPDRALADALQEVLAVPVDLPMATGMPDTHWRDVALRLAQASGRLLSGRLRVSGQEISVIGDVHQPWDLRAVEESFDELPEGYSARLKLRALDDGQPYGLLITRDPRMGLQITGKVPPGFDDSVLDVLGEAQRVTLQEAPLPLPERGFEAALSAALSVFGHLPAGDLSVTGDHVSLSGGPLGERKTRAVQGLSEMLPEGYGLRLDLVPEADDRPLQLRAAWDGRTVQLTGHVPRDFVIEGEAIQSDLTYAPYPDLDDWDEGLAAALVALRGLERGELLYGDEIALNGVAASPDALGGALEGLKIQPAGEIRVRDDGTPPAFKVSYDAALGGEVSGKLPKGMVLSDLSEALGGALVGEVRLSINGQAERILRLLQALTPLMPEVDALVLRYGPEALTLEVQVTPGSDPRAWQRRLGLVPAKVTVSQAGAVDGQTRHHVLLAQDQEARGGRWLPVLAFDPAAQSCAENSPDLSALPYEKGAFLPPDGAVWELAQLIAVSQHCLSKLRLSLEISAQASGTGDAILDRQLARRRAEALRRILLENGISPELITAHGKANDPAQIDLIWD